MKTLFTSVFVFCLVFLAAASPAKESLMALTSVESKDETVKVSFKEAVGKVAIVILDENGKIMARNRYNAKEALVIPFNLSGLPEGNYVVKVRTKDEVALYEVETKEKAPAFERPIVAYGKLKDPYTVNIMVLGIETPGIQVDVFNSQNYRIATDKVNEKDGFTRDYRFTDMKVEGLYFRIKDAQGRTKYLYF